MLCWDDKGRDAEAEVAEEEIPDLGTALVMALESRLGTETKEQARLPVSVSDIGREEQGRPLASSYRN